MGRTGRANRVRQNRSTGFAYRVQAGVSPLEKLHFAPCSFLLSSHSRLRRLGHFRSQVLALKETVTFPVTFSSLRNGEQDGRARVCCTWTRTGFLPSPQQTGTAGWGEPWTGMEDGGISLCN